MSDRALISFNKFSWTPPEWWDSVAVEFPNDLSTRMEFERFLRDRCGADTGLRELDTWKTAAWICARIAIDNNELPIHVAHALREGGAFDDAIHLYATCWRNAFVEEEHYAWFRCYLAHHVAEALGAQQRNADSALWALRSACCVSPRTNDTQLRFAQYGFAPLSVFLSATKPPTIPNEQKLRSLCQRPSFAQPLDTALLAELEALDSDQERKELLLSRSLLDPRFAELPLDTVYPLEDFVLHRVSAEPTAFATLAACKHTLPTALALTEEILTRLYPLDLLHPSQLYLAVPTTQLSAALFNACSSSLTPALPLLTPRSLVTSLGEMKGREEAIQLATASLRARVFEKTFEHTIEETYSKDLTHLFTASFLWQWSGLEQRGIDALDAPPQRYLDPFTPWIELLSMGYTLAHRDHKRCVLVLPAMSA